MSTRADRDHGTAAPIRRWIDLHTHSTASDGRYAPTRLVEMGKARGLSAIALTDHDTVAGLAEAEEAAECAGIEFVPGIELTAARRRGALHLLGYFINPENTALQRMLAERVERRRDRNRAILDRLAALGVDISKLQIAHHATIGRPHIADALVRAGVVESFREAFDRYLADGAPAHIPMESPSPESLIAAISASGGVASLAHPAQLRCESSLELDTLLHRLRDAGLGAIEVHHPCHSRARSDQYLALARRFDLAPTGGSDFHALGAIDNRGVGFARPAIPYEWLDALRERRAQSLQLA